MGSFWAEEYQWANGILLGESCWNSFICDWTGYYLWYKLVLVLMNLWHHYSKIRMICRQRPVRNGGVFNVSNAFGWLTNAKGTQQCPISEKLGIRGLTMEPVKLTILAKQDILTLGKPLHKRYSVDRIFEQSGTRIIDLHAQYDFYHTFDSTTSCLNIQSNYAERSPR